MKMKTHLRRLVDLCMAVALLLLMSYSLIGEAVHEWIGIGMFVLVLLHHILNAHWYRNLRKGRYSALRIFRVVMDLLIILCILGSMISGIMLSRHIFNFLPAGGGASFARTLHMLSAYWGFVLMAVHVGLHINMMISAIRKKTRLSNSPKAFPDVRRALVFLFCIYAVCALVRRQIGSYLFLQTTFVFFDYSESLILFFSDYIAIMGLFICFGHFLSCFLRKINLKILH